MAKENIPAFNGTKEDIPTLSSTKETIATLVSSKESISSITITKEAIAQALYFYYGGVSIGSLIYGDSSSLSSGLFQKEWLSSLLDLDKETIQNPQPDGPITFYNHDGCYTDSDYDGGKCWALFGIESIALSQAAKESLPTFTTGKESIPTSTFTKEDIPTFVSAG